MEESILVLIEKLCDKAMEEAGVRWEKNDQISLCLKNKNQNIKVKSNLKQN